MSDPLWPDVGFLLRLSEDTDDTKGNPVAVYNMSGGDGIPPGLSDNEKKWPSYVYSGYIPDAGAYLGLSPAALNGVAFGQGNFCFDTWIRGRSFVAAGTTLFTTDRTSANPGLAIEHTGLTSMQVRVNDGTTQVTSGTFNITTNAWVYLVVERVGSNIYVLIDGAEVVAARITGFPGALVPAATEIGVGGDGVSNGNRAYLQDLRTTAIDRYGGAAHSVPTGPAEGPAPIPIDALARIPSPISGSREAPDDIELDVANPPSVTAITPILATVTVPAVIGVPTVVANLPAPISASVKVPSPLEGPAVIAGNDFSALIQDTTQNYVMRVSGTPELQIPISSWQATLQVDRQDYVQCVIPNATPYADELSARIGLENFSIYRVGQLNGETVETLIAMAPVQQVAINSGPLRETATMSGYNPDTTVPTPGTVTLTGPRQTFQSLGTGVGRMRTTIDWVLRPGQTAVSGNVSVRADYINYFVPAAGDAYMDVGARG